MQLFKVTVPLTIRYPSGQRHLMVEVFPHPEGLLYFEPFWHLAEPGDGIQLARGPVRGEGPWKVGDAVITVTGCQGSDPEMALQLAQWQEHLACCEGAYASAELIRQTARRHGAEV